MSEGEVTTSIEASAKARDLAAQDSLSDPALSSAERWKLRKFELMEELSGKLRTSLTLTMAVLGVIVALLAGLGYLGMTAYIQSIFKDKIEQEAKVFEKLREDITRRETNLYADQKIFIALLEKYSLELQPFFHLISRSTDEINKSETLNSANMADFKKSLLNCTQQMTNLYCVPDAYKKLRSEFDQNFNHTLRKSDFEALNELLDEYPHIWSLHYVLAMSLNILAKEETTNQE